MNMNKLFDKYLGSITQIQQDCILLINECGGFFISQAERQLSSDLPVLQPDNMDSF